MRLPTSRLKRSPRPLINQNIEIRTNFTQFRGLKEKKLKRKRVDVPHRSVSGSPPPPPWVVRCFAFRRVARFFASGRLFSKYRCRGTRQEDDGLSFPILFVSKILHWTTF
jgi:hypothetical protein